MGVLDIIIVLAFIYAGWKGFKKGFVIELFTFLALFLGLYAGIHFSDYISKILNFQSDYLPIISFTLIFLAIGAMVYFGGKAIEKVVKIAQLNLLNKLLGSLFSILKVIFLFGALIILLDGYDERKDFISDESKSNSILYKPLRTIVLVCIPAFDESTLYLKNLLLEETDIEFEEE